MGARSLGVTLPLEQQIKLQRGRQKLQPQFRFFRFRRKRGINQAVKISRPLGRVVSTRLDELL